MEAATAVQSTTEPVVEAVMQTTGTGINKTNLKNTVHHFDMAQKSLVRAFDLLGAMTDGRDGRIATELKGAITIANAGHAKLIEASNVVSSIQRELEELYA